MALIGYEGERQKIEAAMAAIRKQVDGHAAAPAVDGAGRPKRGMSAAAKRRIAAAQRKRWTAFARGAEGSRHTETKVVSSGQGSACCKSD
jgi:hypothetical protein